MTHVSKKKLPKDVSRLFKEALLEVFKSNTKDDINSILSSLMTKTELVMLYKRLMTILLLSEGLSSDDIAKSTKTTRQTVLRVNDQMKLMNDSDKKLLLHKLANWKRKNLLKSAINNLLEAESPSKIIRNKTRKATGW